MFLFALSLLVLVGTGNSCHPSDYDCIAEYPLARGAINEYENGDDPFPSNGFFQLSCNSILGFLNCYRNLSNNCGLELLKVDVTAAVNHFTTFCDENSSVRKGYANNIACYNNISMTSEDCMFPALETWKMARRSTEILKSMRKIQLETECIFFHILSSCPVDMAEESCGEDAAQNVQDILSAFNDIFMCRSQPESFYDEVLDSLD